MFKSFNKGDIIKLYGEDGGLYKVLEADEGTYTINSLLNIRDGYDDECYVMVKPSDMFLFMRCVC